MQQASRPLHPYSQRCRSAALLLAVLYSLLPRSALAEVEQVFERTKVIVRTEVQNPRFESARVPISAGTANFEVLAGGRFLHDGCSELLIRNTASSELFLADSKKFAPVGFTINSPSEATLRALDLQGDGLDDIRFTDSGGTLHVLISDGRGAFIERPNVVSTNRGERGGPSVPMMRIGPGSAGVVSISQDNETTYKWTFETANGERRLWTEFPPTAIWRSAGFADLNGDGRSDLLAYGGEYSGWWVSLGSKYGGLSRSISGINFFGTPVVFADMDCDGADDVVSTVITEGVLSVAYARLSKGLSGVAIKSKADHVCVTNDQGICFLDDAADVPMPNLEGYLFEETGRELARDAGKTSTAISYVATPIHQGHETALGKKFGIGPSGPGPYVCLGFQPGDPIFFWRASSATCPNGHALMGISIPKHSERWAASAIPRFACCPLPAEDILLDQTVEGTDVCPEDSIAVGMVPGWGCQSCPQRLLCQRINRTRYALGEPNLGVYWGTGRFRDRNDRQVLRTDIPIALRYGLGRTGLQTWDVDGCVGFPWGSVLTRMPGPRSCNQAEFRAIVFAENEGSGAATRPVPMLPECRTITDPTDPSSGCLR